MQSENNQTERFEKALWTSVRKLGPELTAHLSVPLTKQQFFMLYFISNKGVCKVSELAEQMEVKPSAITVMIDRLIKHGVAERRHDDKDRRVVWIELTDKGREVLEEIKIVRKQTIGRYLADIEPQRLELFLDVFEQISETIAKLHAGNTGE
ncbi:putative HTH-type transcriptional regulator YusO [Paenibacillus konkukensis]|uniref:HTH-type transcriptional regulator YusO n=1 Tax=Paenibacillus konkukensis TaxID=2020716 RepID=A0ABY4RNX7_9BACL|nr:MULTISPECIES: MarR family transcriptional regulator [Paenibacillus]UQZ84156.1 putative HTH-type transcriptional regulator YusO [Paenibacillus konkukensis]